jgi:hypothetical protein
MKKSNQLPVSAYHAPDEQSSEQSTLQHREPAVSDTPPPLDVPLFRVVRNLNNGKARGKGEVPPPKVHRISKVVTSSTSKRPKKTTGKPKHQVKWMPKK